AKALSTPFMVSLLRTVYVNGHADPADLINPLRFPNPASIQSHLLDALLPTLIATTRPGTRPETPGRPRAWGERASQRWLSFLATHLNQLGTRDLRWWHVYRDLPTRAWRLVLGITFGLVGGIGSGIVVGTYVWLRAGIVAGVVSGIGSGIVAGI